MRKNGINAVGVVLGMALIAGCGAANAGEQNVVKSQQAASSVVTNENGCVSRTFTECTVTTNGSLVTEHRRETRTNMDVDGNVLETTTSEYAQSYSVGDTGMTPLAARTAPKGGDGSIAVADSFLGLRFGEVFGGTNLTAAADDASLLQAEFKPKKPLAGFDDYYVFVTPKTHKIAKIYACAKEAVEPEARWRRHYLVEALEKRYGTVARLCSYRRPCYAFDVGPDRYITVCLAGASESYETVIAGWDNAIVREAAGEAESIRREAEKKAAERRRERVKDAADAF